jgi:endo-1,4-beta-xylanase
MSEESKGVAAQNVSRRSFLCGAAALLANGASLAAAQTPSTDTSALKIAGRRSGKTLAMFTVQGELLHDPKAAAIIANTFSMIADGNDLKFSNRLRPTPDTYDFSYGDWVVSWAEQHGLLFRGHCLVWRNGLPNWFNSYVTPANAKQVITSHISSVMKHYAGRVYSWDVVNEPIMPDNRPDGLGRVPWLNLMGPEYIDIAFHTAHAADPKARLVLNENFVEHDTPAEMGRRASLLALATRLKKSGVPVTDIGLQGHLRGNVELDKPGMTKFLTQIRDLGLGIMVTELDVDDGAVLGPLVDQTVARKYGEFIELVGPFVTVITFEQLRDDPNLARRSDGLAHRPNLLDADYQPTPSYNTTVRALNTLAKG